MPDHWIAVVSIGQRASAACMPRPISRNSATKPSVAPAA
jgi:hypothetical protein